MLVQAVERLIQNQQAGSQVIVVKSPDPAMFEQAIFILKDSAVREGVTESMLLKQAKQAIGREKHRGPGFALLWLLAGACLTGGILGITMLL